MSQVPRPNPRLFWLLLAGVVPAALSSVSPMFGYLAVGIDVIAGLMVALDLWLWRTRGVEAELALPPRVSRGNAFDAVTSLRNRAPRAQTLHLTQHHPAHVLPTESTKVVSLGPEARVQEREQCVATKRGVYTLHAPVVEHATPLGLGTAVVWPQGAQTLDVLPSTRELARFDALVRQQKLHQMGVARARQRGAGSEIAGLRPYAQGDPLSRIDWKATARKSSLISRDMHTERRQNVVLLLDCGRRMAREVDGRSRLDDAVEAALLLGHVALRSDDRVGLMAFADTTLRAVPPVRGYGSAGVLARAIFDVAPVLREPAYETMASRAHAVFPRRSLMILFTDAVEPESLQSLAKPVRFLSERHLVLCVIFRDASMNDAMRHAGRDADSFFAAGAASDLYVERERNLARLRRAGAMVLEADAGRLSTDVINRYLEIKARRLL